MKPNFNDRSDIKGLRFFTVEICSYYCCFLHTKKKTQGASIHRIDELFPLKFSIFDPLHQRLIYQFPTLKNVVETLNDIHKPGI